MRNIASKLLNKIKFLYALQIERGLYLTWLNPLITVYVNLRLCSLKDAIHLPILVYGWPRLLSLYGQARFIGGGKFGQVRMNRMWHVAGGPNNAGGPSDFCIWGTWIFQGTCSIGTSCKICIGDNGTLTIGDNCQIMSDCNITAYKDVVIEDNLLMAHSSQIFDTGYHYISYIEKGLVKPLAAPIHIGKNCWICNNVTIMGGVSIPSDIIVASHSLVNKTIDNLQPDSLIGGSPAHLLKTGVKRINDHKIEAYVGFYFSNNPQADYCPLNNNL